jgi:hypothetical protein
MCFFRIDLGHQYVERSRRRQMMCLDRWPLMSYNIMCSICHFFDRYTHHPHLVHCFSSLTLYYRAITTPTDTEATDTEATDPENLAREANPARDPREVENPAREVPREERVIAIADPTAAAMEDRMVAATDTTLESQERDPREESQARDPRVLPREERVMADPTEDPTPAVTDMITHHKSPST